MAHLVFGWKPGDDCVNGNGVNFEIPLEVSWDPRRPVVAVACFAFATKKKTGDLGTFH